MNEQSMVALGFLIFSILLLIVAFLFLRQKDKILQRYLRICTGLYVSGTVLVFIVSLAKPVFNMVWMWVCQLLVLGIFAASSWMIIYVIKKFEAGAITPPTDDSGKEE